MNAPPERITRRRLVLGGAAASALLAGDALARPAIFRGGHPKDEAPGGGGGDPLLITTFQVVNTVAVSSIGCIRIGLPITAGDCPPGSSLEIRRNGVAVAAQFDQRASWKYTPADGLHFCTACLRDTLFGPNETRTYELYSKDGPFGNASNVTLAAALVGNDYKVEFTSVVGTLEGPLQNLVASLNVHALRSTRVTKYESGPVADSWEVWGMARPMAGGSDDLNLRTVAYFTRWKNENGVRIADEICFVPTLDQWGTSGKQRLTYTATFRNGATALDTYVNVGHPYRSQWATVRLANDDQCGTRHWIGATRPSLLFKPDRQYWIDSGWMLPYNYTKTYNQSTYPSTYTPIGGQGHQTAIGTTGGFAGETTFTYMDVLAFCSQRVLDVRVMRLSAFAGLHVPYHKRSQRPRQRPGDASADTAQTIPAQVMIDERGAATPFADYDFREDGMPEPAYAYTSGPATWIDGYTVPNGSTSPWAAQGNTSHATSFSLYGYLYTGERYYLNATMDLAANTVNQLQGNATGNPVPLKYYGSYPGQPSTNWVGCGFCGQDTRITAHLVSLISGLAAVPDDDVHNNYCKYFMLHNSRYLDQSIAWRAGTTEYDLGIFRYSGQEAGFMADYLTWDAYAAWARTKLVGYKNLAEFAGNYQIAFAEKNITGAAQHYHMVTSPNGSVIFDPTTNPPFVAGLRSQIEVISITAGSATIAINGQYGMQYTAGDRVMCYNRGANNEHLAITPAETPLGQEFYVVNPVGGTSFQLAATPGGTPIVFSQNFDSITSTEAPRAAFGIYFQASAVRVNESNLGNYAKYAKMAYFVARYYGHPRATTLTRDRYLQWYPASSATIAPPNGAHYTPIET